MVNIKIIAAFDNAKNFMEAVEKQNEDINTAWQKHMIEPFWADITC